MIELGNVFSHDVKDATLEADRLEAKVLNCVISSCHNLINFFYHKITCTFSNYFLTEELPVVEMLCYFHGDVWVDVDKLGVNFERVENNFVHIKG